jgi:cell wall-associated NlpC family hydrolase
MRIKQALLSLILLTTMTHADSSRREPSLFLEYERELKKFNDATKHEDNPFIKPSLATKAPPLAVEPIKPVVLNEPVTILKNTKVDVEQIGESVKPFVVVNKPESPTSSTYVVQTTKVSEEPKNTSQKIVKNLKTAKEKVLSRAKEFLGTPYGYGDKEGGRTDCSGFTQQVYRDFGITLPRSAAEQAMLGESVNIDDLQIGDLLFYRTYKSDPSHVAIYAGNGQIIHASYAAKRVQYDSIEKAYYKNRFIGARRVALNDPTYDE